MFTIFFRRPQEDHVSRDTLVLRCKKKESYCVGLLSVPTSVSSGVRGGGTMQTHSLFQVVAFVPKADPAKDFVVNLEHSTCDCCWLIPY